MTIANVTLSNTFDEWRVRTNQLIAVYDETNTLARASYNATNNFVSTTANLTANIIVSNTIVYDTIYTNANTLTNNIIALSYSGFYDAANASYDQSNAALLFSNIAYNQSNSAILVSNLAYDTANNFLSNISNSVADVLAANTIIQNTINSSVTQLFVDYLANNDLTYVGEISNSAFTKANTAGGYFAGNNGFSGDANNRADIFRVNFRVFTGNIVFSFGENASATGPIYMDANSKLEIQDGARVVIL